MPYSSGVEISLGEPRIYALEPRFPFEELQRRAEEKKTGAVGTGIGGILQRPKADDVVLTASQRRVEPLWHVACTAHYVYDRSRLYTVPSSASDVHSVTMLGAKEFPVVPSGRAPTPSRSRCWSTASTT